MQIPALIASTSHHPGDNYFRGCKWAPDGSCLLAVTNSDSSLLYNLPPIQSTDQPQLPTSEWEPALEVKHSDLVLDFNFYPKMDSNLPETCVFATTCGRDSVRLIDAYTGSTRATYRAIDHLEQMRTAHSVCFSPDGSRIYTGYEKMIRIFRTAIPGTTCDEISFYEEKTGQRGIFSCISFNPADNRMFAVGSFSRQISLSSEPDDYAFCVLTGQKGGVTHLAWSNDGRVLFSGGRKDPEILAWDIRNLGSVLSVMERTADTNQRMFFDVNSSSEYLCSGNTDGTVSIWNISGLGKESEEEKDGSEMRESANSICSKEEVESPGETNSECVPLLSFQAHEDCVNGISFHPSLSMLASCSGQRKFRALSSPEDDETDCLFAEGNENNRENRLKLWSYQQQ